MSNVEKPVLSPGGNVKHAYNNVSITVSGLGSSFTLVQEQLPDPPQGSSTPAGHPAALEKYFQKRADTAQVQVTGAKPTLHWLVAFRIDKKDPGHKVNPKFTVELPEVKGRAETNFYYLEKGRLIFLGQTKAGGGTLHVALELDDPSIGMT
jgi:hypothetical protein